MGEILKPVTEQWMLMANEAFVAPEAFMAFVGLDKPPVEPSSNDINGRNRSQVIRLIHMVQNSMKFYNFGFITGKLL